MDIFKSLKYFQAIILCVLFPVLILVDSCGSDSSTTPNTPPGTVLYSKDSISVWLQPSTFNSGQDSLYFSTSQTGSVEVVYTLQSNIDTGFGRAYWGFCT